MTKEEIGNPVQREIAKEAIKIYITECFRTFSKDKTSNPPMEYPAENAIGFIDDWLVEAFTDPLLIALQKAIVAVSELPERPEVANNVVD